MKSAFLEMTGLEMNSQFSTNAASIERLTDLNEIICNRTGLTTLNLSANTALTSLYCYQNNLTHLDLSANTNLTHLDCRYNPIAEIILADTNNPPVTFLYSGNPIIREP